MTARTFLDAFPHVTLWLPSVRDAVLIGSPDPLRLELDDLSDAYATPATRRNLESAYLETAEAFLATYLLDRTGIERWAGDAPVITDEHPLMEFFRHQGSLLSAAVYRWRLVQDQADKGEVVLFDDQFCHGGDVLAKTALITVKVSQDIVHEIDPITVAE